MQADNAETDMDIAIPSATPTPEIEETDDIPAAVPVEEVDTDTDTDTDVGTDTDTDVNTDTDVDTDSVSSPYKPEIAKDFYVQLLLHCNFDEQGPSLEGMSCTGNVFKADESKCSKYYLCLNGNWMQLECPSPLHWHKVNLTSKLLDIYLHSNFCTYRGIKSRAEQAFLRYC